MHETSLATGLLRIVQDEAQKHKVQRIVRIRLGLGLLACIEAQTLKACFELLAENTVAQSACLDVEMEPLACQCTQCQQHFTLLQRQFTCPLCQSKDVTFTGGHGCTILSIEAATPQNDS